MVQNVSTYDDLVKSFHSTFQDKTVIPETLEFEWAMKAIGTYSHDLTRLNFNQDTLEFDIPLERYIIDTLGLMMKKYYQERELSKVNKRISIVGKDLSIDGTNGSKTATKAELEMIIKDLDDRIYKLTPSAYN